MSYLSIDLGSTRCSIVAFNEEQCELIHDPQSDSPVVIPCMTYGANGWLIGERARREQETNPGHLVSHIKQLLTLKSSELVPKIPDWPFTVITTRDQTAIRLGLHLLNVNSFVQIAYHTFAQWAKHQCGQSIREVILNVPHHYTDSQRELFRKCAQDAGLEHVHLIDDQTAVALVYQHQKQSEKESKRNVIFFNQGASSFHASIFQFSTEGPVELATVDDGQTGGELYDQRLVTHVMNQLAKTSGQLEPQDCPSQYTILKACTEAKHRLTVETETQVELRGELSATDLSQSCNRQLFERLNADLFAYLRIMLDSLLQNSHVHRSEVDEVVLVGGSTRIPRLKQMIKEYFGPRPAVHEQLQFDHVFACGGALKLAKLKGIDRVQLPEVRTAPQKKQVESKSTVILVSDSARLLEAVGFQLDCMPPVTMFPANTPLPAEKEWIYSTELDFQTPVQVFVWEGDFNQSSIIASLRCPDIPPTRSGTPVFRITFEIDTDYRINVSVIDLCSGVESRVIIADFLSHKSTGSNSESRLRRCLERRRAQLEREIQAILRTVDSPNARASLSGDNRETVRGKCKSIHTWISSSEEKTLQDFEHKRQELLEIWLPYASKLYSKMRS